jgi:phospholipase C
MSDNSYSTTFGPSAPGAINLVAGDTGGVDMVHQVNSPSVGPNSDLIGDSLDGRSLTGDAQPYRDDLQHRRQPAAALVEPGQLRQRHARRSCARR